MSRPINARPQKPLHNTLLRLPRRRKNISNLLSRPMFTYHITHQSAITSHTFSTSHPQTKTHTKIRRSRIRNIQDVFFGFMQITLHQPDSHRKDLIGMRARSLGPLMRIPVSFLVEHESRFGCCCWGSEAGCGEASDCREEN